MKFIDALENLYKNRTSVDEFADPFLLYCRLSDLCGAGYQDKRKVLLFYQVNSRLNIVKALLDKDESVYSKYQEVADLLAENSYKRLLESVKGVLYPEQKKVEKAKPQAKPQTNSPQNNPKPNNVKTNNVKPKPVAVPVVVKKAEESKQVQTRTPLTSPSYNAKADKSLIVGLSVVGGIVFAIGLFILLACVLHWPWAVWQWLVGIVGGAILSVIVVTIVIGFDDSCILDYYVLGSILLGIFAVVNFILALVLKGDYKTIFAWISIYELILGLGLTFATFSDIEEWGAFQIVELIAVAIFFIIIMACI